MKPKYFSYSGVGRVYQIRIPNQPSQFVGVGAISKCDTTPVASYYCIPIYKTRTNVAIRQLSTGYYTIQKSGQKWIVSESMLLGATKTIDISNKDIPKKSSKDNPSPKPKSRHKHPVHLKSFKRKDNSLAARKYRISQYLTSVAPDQGSTPVKTKKKWKAVRSSYWGETSVHAVQGGGCTPK